MIAIEEFRVGGDRGLGKCLVHCRSAGDGKPERRLPRSAFRDQEIGIRPPERLAGLVLQFLSQKPLPLAPFARLRPQRDQRPHDGRHDSPEKHLHRTER